MARERDVMLRCNSSTVWVGVSAAEVRVGRHGLIGLGRWALSLVPSVHGEGDGNGVRSGDAGGEGDTEGEGKCESW